MSPGAASFDEAAEPEAAVNVVYHRDPAGRQRRPYRAELETDVSRRVQAVMNEEVDLLERADQSRQPLPARPLHVRPAGPQILWNGNGDLVMQRRIYSREIDAPQVTVPVAVKALKDHPAGEPMCHPRLHDRRGTQVRDQAPDGLGLRPIAVVPPAVRGQAHLQARRGQAGNRGVPYLAELFRFLARPRRVDRVVQNGRPVLDDRVMLILRTPERSQLAPIRACVDTPANAFKALTGMTQGHGCRAHGKSEPHRSRPPRITTGIIIVSRPHYDGACQARQA